MIEIKRKLKVKNFYFWPSIFNLAEAKNADQMWLLAVCMAIKKVEDYGWPSKTVLIFLVAFCCRLVTSASCSY